MILSAWLALVVGLSEVVVLMVRVELWQNGLYRKGPGFVWMIPSSLLCLFLATGILLAIASRASKRRRPGFWAYLLLALAYFTGLLAIPGIRAIACAILACGLAKWTVPFLQLHARAFGKIVDRGLPCLALSVVILTAISFARPVLSERGELATVAPAARGAPNVLFVVMDTVRADALSLHGYPRQTTPNLARLAEKGVRFDRAIAPASWTLPSHASMFTGRWPDELHVGLNDPLDDAYPTLAAYLSRRGYATAGFSANTFFCNRWYGLNRGFMRWEDYAVTPLDALRSSGLGYLLCKRLDSACNAFTKLTGLRFRQTFWEESSRKDADRINRDLLSWLDAPRDRPFFAFLNYFDVHDPYLPPDSCAPHFGLSPETVEDDRSLRGWLLIDKNTLPQRAKTLARDNYDDCIAYLDDRIGRLFGELERRGTLDNTVVIITSDHGEHFGEHGLYGHRASVYSAVTHVPLLILGPPGRVPSDGVVVREPVSLRDLPATVVDILGLKSGSPFPGTSLSGTWGVASTAASHPTALAFFDYRSGLPGPGLTPATGGGRLTSAVRDGKMLVIREDGREELYDLDVDPQESCDRAGEAESREILDQLRRDVRERGHHPEP